MVQQLNNRNVTPRPTDNRDDMSGYSLRDILEMVFANWYWFFISIGFCMVVAVYYIYTTPKVYQRQATIMIKDSRRGGSAAAIFADLSSMKAIPNVDNEMYILGSKRLMEMVVDTLNLNINYTYSGKARTYDLYGRSPFVVEFPNDLAWQSLTLEAIPTDNGRIKLTNFQLDEQEEPDPTIVWATLGQETITPVGIVRISPTAYYDTYLDRTIRISKSELEQTALQYKNALNVSLAKKESSIILLSINDINAKRAEDILNALMQSYDDDVRADKDVVLEATKEFLSQRIGEVTTELENIDQAAQSYSERHNVVDLSSQTSLSISEAQRYKTEAIGIETQKMLVGSIQTSTATVAVLPEVEDVEVEIKDSDLIYESCKSSGAGGQHINKTESAVRLTHKPTGIVIECQEERSQFKNKDKALKMLRAKLYDIKQREQSEKVASDRKSQVGTGDRSEKIRTYNYPQNRVTDHRIGLTLYSLEDFLNGNIGGMIDSLIATDTAEKLKAENKD